MKKKKTVPKPKTTKKSQPLAISINEVTLFKQISRIIENRKRKAMINTNKEVVLMNWEIGRYINSVILDFKRAEYGKRILATVSQQLVKKYGQGFEYTKITRMIKFAELFSDIKIVSTLATHLSWSHFIELLPLKSKEARLYYAKYERQEGENEPIGLILCPVANRGTLELMEMDKSGIAVAEFWTTMPPKNLVSAIETADTNPISDIKTSLISSLNEELMILCEKQRNGLNAGNRFLKVKVRNKLSIFMSRRMMRSEGL